MVWQDDANRLCDEVQRLVALVQTHRPPFDAPHAAYQAAMAQICDQDVGPIHDLMTQLKDLFPRADPGPRPIPEPPQLQGVAVTYSGHGNARDVYLGLDADMVQWGPHDSLELRAPANGRVELYQFPTPLDTFQAMDATTRARHRALFRDWICMVPAAWTPANTLLAGEDAWWVAPATATALGQQVMNVPVFWYDTPAPSRLGLVRALWFGHARNGARTGGVLQGEVFGLSGASGIQFERGTPPNPRARAAHVHACASVSGQLSPNGDVDGMIACELMGWEVQFIGDGPGPQQYQLPNVWTAGRRTSDFTAAGRPIPRIAPD